MQRLSGRREAPSGPIFCRRSFPVKNRFRGPAGPNPFFSSGTGCSGPCRIPGGAWADLLRRLFVAAGSFLPTAASIRLCRENRIRSVGLSFCVRLPVRTLPRSPDMLLCVVALLRTTDPDDIFRPDLSLVPGLRRLGRRVRKSGGSRSRTAADKDTGTGATCG